MALPNPNPDGTATAGTPSGMKALFGSGMRSEKQLIELNKGFDALLKTQEKMLQILEKAFGGPKEDPSELRKVEDTAGGVSAEKLNWKDIMGKAGGFGNILGAALLAYVFDLDKYIRATFAAPIIFKGLGAAFKTVFGAKVITDFLKNLKPVKDFLTGFKNVGKVMGAVATPVAIKEFTSVFGKIGATIKTIGNFFKPLLNVFKFLGQLSGITSIVKNAGGLFSKIMPILKGIGSKLLLPLFAIFDFVSGFIKGFASKGEGDTRSTMERLLDGLAGGFIKMIKGIFIVPLDLLKDGVAWIARQMGFEKFADALGKFSFNDTFDKLIKFGKNLFSSEPEEGYFSIVKWFNDLFKSSSEFLSSSLATMGEWWSSISKFATNLFSSEPEEGYFSIVKFMADKVQAVRNWFDTLMTDPVKALQELASGYLDIITSPAKFIWDNLIKPAIEGIMKMFGKEVELPSSGGVGDMINNFFKSILRAILPKPNDNAKWYDIPNLISKAIPADVYKFAGLDPKTGEIVIDDTAKVEAFKASTNAPGLKPEGVATGELSRNVAAKKEGGGGTTVVDQSQKSGDVVTQNSSTSVSQGKTSARKENPASGKIK